MHLLLFSSWLISSLSVESGQTREERRKGIERQNQQFSLNLLLRRLRDIVSAYRTRIQFLASVLGFGSRTWLRRKYARRKKYYLRFPFLSLLYRTSFMPETSSGSPFFFSCSVFLHFPLKFLDLICEIFHQESSGLCARGREGGGRREKNGNLLTQICMVDRNRKRQTKMKSFSGSLTVSEWVRDKLKKKEERTPGRLSTVCDPLHSQILAPFFFSPVNLAKQCQLFLLDQRQFLKASSIAVGLCSKLKLLNAFMVASQVFLAEFRSLSDCGVCICPGLFMSCDFEVFSRHLFNAQWHLLHVEVRPIKRPVYVIKVDWKVHTRWMETEREGERKVSALLRRSSQQSLRGEIWFDSRIFIFLPVSFLAEKKDMKHFHAAIFKRTNRNIRDANSNTNRS